MCQEGNRTYILTYERDYDYEYLMTAEKGDDEDFYMVFLMVYENNIEIESDGTGGISALYGSDIKKEVLEYAEGFDEYPKTEPTWHTI